MKKIVKSTLFFLFLGLFLIMGKVGNVYASTNNSNTVNPPLIIASTTNSSITVKDANLLQTVMPKPADVGIPYPDITTSLRGLMFRNEYIYGGGYYYMDLSTFYNLVKNSGPLDLKNQGWTGYSNYVYDGGLVPSDAPGNILYGYLGKVFGIPDTVLLAGAGYAQIKAGTGVAVVYNNTWVILPTWGDDPRDQYYIQQGIAYYNSIH